MGMNPETNKFEQLKEHEEAFKDALKEMELQKDQFHVNLIRPDGSLVPKHWSVFKVGELVTIKDYTFRVAYIGESNILFEPVKATDPITIPDVHGGE